MNTNNFIDIADFLNQKLEDLQITPPANVWERVQSEIPNYSAKGLGQWIWYSSVILVAGISLFFYFYSHNNQISTPAKKIIANQISVPDRKVTVPILNKENSISQANYISLKTSQKDLSVTLENKTLYLEASMYSTIERVEFFDSTSTIRKVIQKPTVNEFGFYSLDISSLKKGLYQIYIYSGNGKKYQRTENIQ